METLRIVLALVLVVAVGQRSTLALSPAGTCLRPNSLTYLAAYYNVFKSLLDCPIFAPYDVTQIKMSILSAQNLSAIDLLTTPDEFAAKGCCGKPTLFTHHGWLESKDVAWNPVLQLQYAQATGGCAVAFDYQGAAAENLFCTTYQNIGNIGLAVSKLVYSFVQTGCLVPTDITLAGFSMGSPIAIRNAYNLLKNHNIPIGKFYGLDPGGPFNDENFDPPESFYYDAVVKRSPNVQCIHTSNVFGTNNHHLCPSAIITGNCLMVQPECYGNPNKIICDHIKAPSFLIQTIKSPGSIVASSCPTNCPSIFSTCSNPVTEVVGYQTGFKTGQFYYNDPKTCIDIYY